MPAQTHMLKIITLNVQSIIGHQRRHNLQQFLALHKPDLLLITETHLVNKHRVHFRNHEMIRTDKHPDKATTGTAILIKDTIKKRNLATSTWNLQALEVTAVLVHTSQRPICVIAAYRHATNRQHISHDLTIITDLCEQNRWDVIIGGDFNAKHPSWHNQTICTQGRALDSWLEQNQIQRHLKLECPCVYTFRNNYAASVLDFFIISDSLNIIRGLYNSNLDVLDYDSDHRAVVLNTHLAGRIFKKDQQFTPNYLNVDWSHFKNQLDTNIRLVEIPESRNMSAAEIDHKLEELCGAIKTTMDEVIPQTSINKDNICTLPPDILDLIRHKNQMRRRWERRRLQPIAAQLKTEIKLLSKIIDERINITRNDQFEHKLAAIKPGARMFGQIKMLGQTKVYHSPSAIVDPVTSQQSSDTVDMCNILAANFEQVHKQNDNLGDAAFTTDVNNFITSQFNSVTPRFVFSIRSSANPTTFNAEHHFISIPTLQSIIKRCANKKSCGHDGIPNTVLRKLSTNCIKKIATLFNQTYNISYFPKAWKMAIVVPILKPAKPATEATSYRPISLLPCLSKIYERALKHSIDIFCEDNQIIPNDQFGFMAGRSTTQALTIFKTDISVKFNHGTPTIACAMDIEKAFDTVWQHGLLYKMLNTFHFDHHLCKCIYNYLQHRTFKVKLADKTSDERTISAGVPQGGVLSAILYIIFVADMPSPIPHLIPIRRLQYADDMIIYIATKHLVLGQNRINTYIAEIKRFYDKWKIRINPQKSEAIVFKGPNRLFNRAANKYHNNVTIKISEQTLVPQTTLKYLGVTFSKNLRNVRHIDHIIKKVRATTSCLRPLLCRKRGLSTKIKLLCYKQLIRSQICHGFPSWSDISSAQMERLRQIERACIRSYTNTWRGVDHKYISNAILMQNANIPRIDRFLVNQALKHLEKHHDNPNMQRCLRIYPANADTTDMPYKPPWHLEHLNSNNQLYTDGKLLYYHRPYYTQSNNLVYNTAQ